ncbi:MAG TPA: thioredoxin [Terriglobia bacterium]|nr:thioredoxin [Terriglobia bacterium]
METILHVQQNDWQSIEASAKPVLVDFWANWCAPCRMLAPTFEKLAARYGNEITFAKVDVDELPELAGKLGIRSIPTLLLFERGKVVEQIVGARCYDDLARVLDKHATAATTAAPAATVAKV